MPDTMTDDVVAAAAALGPLIPAARDELEELRRLPTALAQALHRTGLLQVSLLRSIGGRETDPLTSFRAIEELSRADGSVGVMLLFR